MFDQKVQGKTLSKSNILKIIDKLLKHKYLKWSWFLNLKSFMIEKSWQTKSNIKFLTPLLLGPIGFTKTSLPSTQNLTPSFSFCHNF